MPIVSNDPTSVALRPTRSPKWPNRTEPMGRATKASPKVANDDNNAAVSSPDGKNNTGNTSTAAVA